MRVHWVAESAGAGRFHRGGGQSAQRRAGLASGSTLPGTILTEPVPAPSYGFHSPPNSGAGPSDPDDNPRTRER
jgi:hypothetical protein